MNFFKYTLIIILSFYASIVSSQERVTTFGIQFKPIVPIEFMNSGQQETVNENIQFSQSPKAGLSFGMVIRKGFTKNLSIETGINFLRRNYDFSIVDVDSSFSLTSSFRLINYEIPVLGLVYVRLSNQIYMNVAGGFSVDIYPTPLFTFDNDFANAINRFDWFNISMLANVGWEYRTEKSGYFYLGASFHRPFSDIAREFITYKRRDEDVQGVFDLTGNYLTIDLRYFFHEDQEKKKKKQKKKIRPVKKDFRQPRESIVKPK